MDNNQTQHFSVVREELDVHMILERVYEALQEKGYNPVNQMVGYIMSGDPTYITSHNNARSIINKVERDDIIEALLENYIETRLNRGIMRRILGLDYGTKTVGVALSDELHVTAQPLETITRKDANKLRKTYARIEELVKEYDVEKIVLGLPKNMNNTVGERGEDTLSFRDALVRRTGLEVILWDERLTTVASEKVLMESGVRRENRKKVIDQIAASMILQGYLDSL